MIRLIAGLLLVGLLFALVEVDQVAAQILARVDSSRAQGETVDRASRGSTIGAASRSAGFRTTHVFVPTAVPSRYDQLIERYASQAAIRPELVRAVVQVESGFDPRARSPVGAMGLMQLMPQTAAELGVSDPYDPEENLRAGTAYLKQLLTRYGWDEAVALAAYNAGPAAVARHGNRPPPYPETINYIRNVRSIAAVAARRPAPADDAVYKSYAIVDGWWTVVYSNVPPAAGHYEVTAPVPAD